MNEAVQKTEFYHFGIALPICIHIPIEDDQYSKMYVPREKCHCGHSEWVDGKMDMIIPLIRGHKFPPQDIHRCKNCNAVRMADHISLKRKKNEHDMV